MAIDLTSWTAILLVALVTYLSRIAGMVMMARAKPSPRLARFLDGVSVSVIAALVATMMARGGLREAASVALAVGIMLVTRSAVWALICGIAAAGIWSAMIP